MDGIVQLLGRIMLAIIFILAGLSKLMDPAGTVGFMQSMGVPTILLWPTIVLELLGGLAIVIGYKIRLVAWALALFSIAAAVIFHADFADKMQMILFLKNIAIAGGLLILASNKKSAYSLDSKKQETKFFATRQ